MLYRKDIRLIDDILVYNLVVHQYNLVDKSKRLDQHDLCNYYSVRTGLANKDNHFVEVVVWSEFHGIGRTDHQSNLTDMCMLVNDW